VRGYLTASLGSAAAARTSDWRYLLANPQFRRFFSSGSKKSK
jgi:AFG3 family protein